MRTIEEQKEALKGLRKYPLGGELDFEGGALSRFLFGDRSHDPIDAWFGRHPWVGKVLVWGFALVMLVVVIHHQSTF
jgi:hypothetical protein